MSDAQGDYHRLGEKDIERLVPGARMLVDELRKELAEVRELRIAYAAKLAEWTADVDAARKHWMIRWFTRK